MESNVQKGDFIQLSFEGKTSADGSIFEKTSKPILVVAGRGQVVPGLDSAILNAKPGEQNSVQITEPSDAFGERKDDLVRLVPIEQFRRQGIEPVAGMPVELDNVPARIQSVSGGRVRVDINH